MDISITGVPVTFEERREFVEELFRLRMVEAECYFAHRPPASTAASAENPSPA